MMNRVAACLAVAVLGMTVGVATAAAPAIDHFDVAPGVPTVGDSMTLTAPASPDGTPYVYEWDTDDDGTFDDSGQSVTVPVVDPADHVNATVVLKITDPNFPDEPTFLTKAFTVDHKPVAKFTRSPAGPLHANDVGTFTDQSEDLDGDIKSWTWRVDGVDQGEGDATTHALTYKFPGPGKYKVTLTVRDQAGHTDTSPDQVVDVVSRPPVATFSFSPTDPIAGQEVQLDAHDSYDPDGSDISYAWETTGDDQFDDGADPTSPLQKVTFPTPGEHIVKLRVSDGSGASDVYTRTVIVKPKPNVAPVAGFTYAPAAPLVAQLVTFTSTSSDADGTIAKYLWDVDNDGKFVDGGPTLTAAFTRAGPHTVTLKVIDDAGGVATTFNTVTVRPAPVTPPPNENDKAKTAVTPATLNPFPIVRMRGLILRRGVNIQILSIRAPTGAVVTVRCKGRGCPVKRVRVKLHGKQRGVRIHKLERRLRVGTVIEIRVTKRNWIGKYTRFVIRRNAAPSRRDLCIGTASGRPVRCAA